MNVSEEIISAGITLIKKYGAVFPVDELCAMINISKKTFYIHFENKNDLMAQILQQLVQKWKVGSEHLIDTEDSIKARFMQVFLYHLNEITLFNSHLFSGLQLKYPQAYMILDNYFKEVHIRLVEILKQGQTQHLVKKEYNLDLFLEKETAFWGHLCNKNHFFAEKEDYIKLLELSLDGIIAQ